MANFTIPYTTPADYTYDDSKIEVSEGLAKLKLQNSLQSFEEDFADDTGFTYDSDLAEFAGDFPTDATFYASYNNSINANWGEGILTGTAYGGASISDGKLDLAHGDERYVDYNAVDNADSQQVGCIRFKVIPNYSNAPANDRWFFAICKQNNSKNNLIELRHSNSGAYLRLHVYDKDGIFVVEQLFGQFLPVAGTEYEIEVDWDFTTGATRLFINGVQNGSTCVSTCLRDSNIGLLRIGNDYDKGAISDFKINDFLVFSTVQHTSNYTPDWSNIPEVLDYKIQQKDKRPTDAIFYASYNDFIDGNWGNGSLIGTAYGGASISNGKLDLAHNDNRYVTYSAINNANFTQTGTIRFKIIPNFSTPPGSGAYMGLFTVFESEVNLKNNIQVVMSGTGSIFLQIYDNNGNLIENLNAGVWSCIQGISYEFEIDIDLINGQNRIFINGNQLGSTGTGTGVRNSNSTLFRVGQYRNPTQLSNFYFKNLLIFSTVQHTSNYTPDWSDIYEYDYLASTVTLPEMEHTLPGDLTIFDSFVTIESGSPRYTLQIERSGNYLYWNGADWVVSDGSYAQANDSTTFNNHVDDLDVAGKTYGQFKIHFDNSNTQSDVDNLIANLYMDTGYPTTKPTIYKTNGDGVANIEEWISFVETLGGNNEGSVTYQLSEDGITWKYWNGSIWTNAGASDYNTAEQVDNNILSFPADADKIYVKAFFLSNGLQLVELDLNEVGYVVNTNPNVYAGTNKNVIYNVATTPFSDCLFSDAEGNITKAEWKEEGGAYVEIAQGAYATLLEAVQAFSYIPTHSGNKTLYLKITDSYDAYAEDTLVINVDRVSISITIKDEYDNNIPNVLFNPGDGSGVSLKSSPFTHVYYIGSWTATGTKNRFQDLSEAVTISIASTSLDFEMEKENLSYEISLTLPEKIFRGDSVTIDAKVDNNITGFKIRAEIFDNELNSIKLANSASGGSDTEIEMVNPSIGEFSIYIAKDTTDSFNLNSKIEIELVNTDDKVVTIYRGNLKFDEEQITWTTN